MKLLVTGGAGYIGAALVPALLDAGHEVTVVDNFRYGQLSLLAAAGHPNLRIIRGDARDEALMRRELTGSDAILPLAALTGAPVCEKFPEEARLVNLEAVKLILALRRPEQRIVFPTTNSGYGIGEKDSYCTEETPLRPVSLYGRLKVEAEQAALKGGNAITLRLATVFGISPRMRLDLLVNDFVHRAVRDGYVVLFEPRFRRNYIHLRDVARAFLHCLAHFETLKNEAYNVGLSSANLNKRQLAEEIKKQVPSLVIIDAPVGFDPDKRDYLVSNSKFEKTGFQAKVTLAEGIAELIRGYAALPSDPFRNQ